ncbi:MAG: hypothetical protein OEY89_17435 [Gammaproteobacteria bacterium]|nr:hypothetical protein [Gammaproteobacteria bacterium]
MNRGNRKSKLVSVASLLLLAVLSGCSTVQIGRDFDVKAFEEIAGMADMSKAQVRDLLGAPKSTGVAVEKDGSRLVEWVYFYGSGQLPSMSDTNFKMLEIRFNQAGMMQSYNWSSSQ